MRMGGPLFVAGILVRLSPDSARTKNTMANIIASQKSAVLHLIFSRSYSFFARQRSGFSFTSRPNRR
jgi:hypothetical protein